jgi:PiT family inorganic phosphate transporter
MGIITGALVAGGYLSTFEVPFWVIMAAHAAIGLGTLSWSGQRKWARALLRWPRAGGIIRSGRWQPQRC